MEPTGTSRSSPRGDEPTCSSAWRVPIGEQSVLAMRRSSTCAWVTSEDGRGPWRVPLWGPEDSSPKLNDLAMDTTVW